MTWLLPCPCVCVSCHGNQDLGKDSKMTCSFLDLALTRTWTHKLECTLRVCSLNTPLVNMRSFNRAQLCLDLQFHKLFPSLNEQEAMGSRHMLSLSSSPHKLSPCEAAFSWAAGEEEPGVQSAAKMYRGGWALQAMICLTHFEGP